MLVILSRFENINNLLLSSLTVGVVLKKKLNILKILFELIKFSHLKHLKLQTISHHHSNPVLKYNRSEKKHLMFLSLELESTDLQTPNF